MKVAFFGTGLMGSPMCTRMARAGHRVRAWNRSPEKVEALAPDGVIACASPAEAVRGADLVCLCLSDGSAVEALLCGEANLATMLAKDQIVADFGTSGVAATIRFAAAVRADWLDCPVSGGVVGAERGELSMFVGGSAQALAQARAALEAVACNISRLGPVGAGQAAKLCNQLIVSTTLTAIAEAFALGEALGVDVNALPGALAGGFADSAPLRLFGPRMAAAIDPGPRVAALSTMLKDVLLCARAAEESQLNLPVLKAVLAAYQGAATAGLADRDLPALLVPLRQGPAS